MVNDEARVYVGERLDRETPTFLLLVDKGNKRLLDNPPARPLRNRSPSLG
jgi:hypothetical protein